MQEIKNFNQNIISIDVLMDGGLGNQIDGATELALTNILQRFKED